MRTGILESKGWQGYCLHTPYSLPYPRTLPMSKHPPESLAQGGSPFPFSPLEEQKKKRQKQNKNKSQSFLISRRMASWLGQLVDRSEVVSLRQRVHYREITTRIRDLLAPPLLRPSPKGACFKLPQPCAAPQQRGPGEGGARLRSALSLRRADEA